MTEAAAFWNPVAAPEAHWSVAYPVVERAAKALLTQNPAFAGKRLTTDELVEALYPAAQARGPGIKARTRLYKALFALASHGLAAYCTRGAPRTVRGKEIRPYLWHAPVGKTCPHCGGVL